MVNQKQAETPVYIWNGVYPTWSDACEAAAEIGVGALSSEHWFRRITQQLEDYRSELQKYGVAIPPRPCSLPLVCTMTNPCGVMDFGGSSGWCWDYVQNSLPRHGISSYVVVETNAVVSYMNKAAIHATPIKFRVLEDSLDPCDLLYCNSVMQYFGSNASLLSLIDRTTPEHILLEDLVVIGDADYYTVQSYPGSAIPYRFIGLHSLIQDLSCAGYTELVRFPYASPVLGLIKPFEMGNFPSEKRLRYSSSILFKKIEG